MRDLGRVLTYIMRHVIPEDQVILMKDLDLFYHKICYTPPEMMGACWYELGLILHSHLGVPQGVEWHERLGRIMRDEEKVPDGFDPLLPHVDDYVVVTRV